MKTVPQCHSYSHVGIVDLIGTKAFFLGINFFKRAVSGDQIK